MALSQVVTRPLFFEIHRLSEFTPRSLDVDVVLDLMIHDIDIVLTLTRETPQEIRAAGIRILTPKVDIANVRLQFPGGCVANLTASRVSTERVRKLRLFQPHEYISLDYTRKDAARFRVKPPLAIDFSPLPVTPDEPLRLELEAFFSSVMDRSVPMVTGEHGLAALEVATGILDRIEAHSRLVAQALLNPYAANASRTGRARSLAQMARTGNLPSASSATAWDLWRYMPSRYCCFCWLPRWNSRATLRKSPMTSSVP